MPRGPSNPAAETPRGKRAAGRARPGRHRFTKMQRVRRRPEFKHIFDRGRRVHGRFLTLLLLPNGLPVSRLGLVASKKLGDAVERNRAKRLIREVFRQHQTEAGEARAFDIVVIPRRELLKASFRDLTADFASAFRRGQGRPWPERHA